jgi:hypothetical protein
VTGSRAVSSQQRLLDRTPSSEQKRTPSFPEVINHWEHCGGADKGNGEGTAESGDSFGFVSEQIGAFQVGGTQVSLSPGPRNDLAGVVLGSTNDVTMREVG